MSIKLSAWGGNSDLFPPAIFIFLFMKPERALWPTGMVFLGVFFFVGMAGFMA